MEYLELLFWPIIAALLLAVIASPLGVFVVWQRQSYFGATLAHSALLGVSIALVLNTPITATVIGVSLLIAAFIFYLSRQTQLSSDTLLGILAHSSLAFGIAVISLQDSVQIDLMGYLFGDLLSVEPSDVSWLVACGLLVWLFFQRYWSQMLNLTFNAELAQVEGTPVKQVQLGYVLLLAFTIALAMKMVGVLLVTSMLIIPAASARRLSKSPEQMLQWTIILGLTAVAIGILLSIEVNIPTGASIVIVSSLLFLLLQFKPGA